MKKKLKDDEIENNFQFKQFYKKIAIKKTQTKYEGKRKIKAGMIFLRGSA